MKTKRLLAILVIILALVILAVIIYFLFFYNFGDDIRVFLREKEIIKEEEEIEKKQVVKKIPAKEEKVIEASKEEVERANLQKTASSFAERFGSYSNHSDYENITDLKVFMSKKMAVWADEFIEESKAEGNYEDVYQGVVTKAVSSEVLSINESLGRAEVLVKTQKIKSSGTTSNTSTGYEDILIIFIKEDGIWKIDSAYWQEE